MKIEEIEGIGATQAAKLAQAGVTTTDDLLQWGANKAGRKSLGTPQASAASSSSSG